MIRGTRRPRLATVIACAAVALATAATAVRAALPQQSGTDDLLTQANVEIDGAAAGDSAASSVAAAGDVNGDGIQDVIIGALTARNNNRNNSGSAYVVFGQASPTRVDLANLGSHGFRIDGAGAGDTAGGGAVDAKAGRLRAGEGRQVDRRVG